MAIRLASAIGEQRKPMSPFEGLSDVIAKTGSDINEGIKAKREAEAKKTALNQSAKDAISRSIKTDPVSGVPEEVKEYETYIQQGFETLFGLRNDPSVTPDQYEKAARDFEYGAKQRALKYKEDAEVYKQSGEMKDAYHLDEFAGFLTGTPDKKFKETIPVDPAEIEAKKQEIEVGRKAALDNTLSDPNFMSMTERQKEEISKGINQQFDEKISEIETPKTEEKIVKGREGYWSLPFDKKLEIDLRTQLKNKAIPVTPNAIDVAKGVLGSPYTMSYVTTIQKTDGSSDYVVDEKALEIDAESIADKFKNPPAVSPNKEFNLLNRSLEAQAMDFLMKNKPQGEITPEDVAETKKQLFKSKFLEEARSKIREDQLKMREARANSRSGSGSKTDSKEPRVEQIKGSVPPPLEQLRRNQIGDLDEKIQNAKDELNLLKNRARGATGEVKTEEVKNAAAKAKEQSESIAKWEQEKKNVENKKYDVNDYYIFSTKTEAIDNELNFYIEGKPSIAVKPTSIFREGGKTYIGGLVKEEGEMKDVLYPYDENNRGVLKTNKPELVVKLDKLGFKTNEDEAASKKSGKTATAPKAAAKNVLDKIKAKTTKPIAEYQVNKKGTKAKVKFSDGTEQEIDL